MSYEIKNVYTIFFASSITELEIERLRLTNFVNKLSGDYLEQFFEIRLKPVICEDEDPCMAHAGKQTEYDDAIRESRMCFFVFHKKVGKYTEHELEVAKAAFDKTELPKIYFFFKKPHGEEFSEEVAALQAKLDKDFGHYYTFFEDIDTVHLRIVLQIMRQVLPEVYIELKDGKVLARNMPVPGVDPMSLPEFRNNKDLARMREEYAALDAECKKLYEQFKQPDCPADIIAEYSRKAAERARLKEETEQLLANIFNISKEICSESGVVDAKRRAAYRYLEEGDSKKALEMLDEGELLAEGERLLSKADETEAEVKSLIDSWKLRIDILLTMTGDEERFAKVRAAYETIEKYVERFRVGTEKIWEYAVFLDIQNDHKLAYAKALKYLHFLEADKILEKHVPDEMLYRAYIVIGDIALRAKQYKKSLEYLKKAHELAQHLDKYANWLTNCGLGGYYGTMYNFETAVEYYQKALEIIEELYKESPTRYAWLLIQTYCDVGGVYHRHGEYLKARDWYEKAIDISEKHYAENPAACAIALAPIYNNLGVMHTTLEEYDTARDWDEKAAGIYKKLYAENPAAYAPFLAMIYNNLGYIYNMLSDADKAREWAEKALDLYEKLHAADPVAYAPELGRIYGNLGLLHANLDESDKAREWYEKALGIYEKLYAENPAAYAPSLAGIYDLLAVLYENQDEPGKAQEWQEKAIPIYEKLYASMPSVYASDLADRYYNLGLEYHYLNDYDKAREYYEKAVEIREKLCAEDLSTGVSDLADAYNNLGVMHLDLDEYDEAKEYYAKALQMWKKLYAEDPSTYASDLAITYANFGILHDNLKEYDKAREYYEKAVEMFEELYAEDASAYAENLTGVYCGLARCCEAMGKTELAKEYRDKAAAVK